MYKFPPQITQAKHHFPNSPSPAISNFPHMDESWRMRMGTSSLNGRRQASEDFTSWTTMDSRHSNGAMEPDDFKDVFGGPPRSVVNRQLSCDFTSYDYFYNEIFRRPEAERSRRTGRRLPEFTIPIASRAIEEKANDDCKGADDEHKMKKSTKLWRSMSMSKWSLKSKSKLKSKSNSSSVVSYEENTTPIRSGIGEDDAALTSIAAKLRPINVPCRWNSTNASNCFSEERLMRNSNPSYSQPQQFPSNPQHNYESATGGNYKNQNCSEMAFQYSEEHLMRNSNPQQFPSPDTHIIPYWTTTVGIPVDDADELESPSSASNNYKVSCEQGEDEEDDEYMSSHVIEVSSRGREAADIDEAIAWAKDKYNGGSSSSMEVSSQFGG